MELLDASKSIIENIYLISGPTLAVLGVVAIFQLKLTKKAIIISSKRQSAELATKQLEYYESKIISALDNLSKIEREDKLDKIELKIGNFKQIEIINQLGKEKTSQLIKEREKHILLYTRILNSFEAFSTYFTKGIANEEIAFSAVGKTFCYSIEYYYFYISVFIDESNDISYQNTIELYKLWSQRIKKEKLHKEKQSILSKLNQIPDTKIDPIGTK